MAKMSLLEQAKSITRPDKRLQNISDEEIELALAWLNDDISLTAIAQVLGMKGPGNAASRISILLREAYRRDMLKVKL